MRIKPDSLEQHIEKSLPPVLVISGDEPFLVQESASRYRQACRNAGFTERLVYNSGKGFDWQELESHTQSLSLFGEKKIVELQWSALPEEPGKRLLQHWAENPPEDTCLLITSSRIAPSTLNAKWFGTLEKHSLHVTVWPISAQELPHWVTRRLQKCGFRATRGAVKALCENVEGNLLAASQEVEKLALLFPPGDIDETQVLQSVADSSHYSVFDLASEVLKGQSQHALHILHTLQGEGVAASIVLWTLARDIRVLGKLKRRQGEPSAILKKAGIPKMRWGQYESCSSRIQPARLMRAHRYCRQTDEAIKGLGADHPWLLIQNACLLLCNVDEPGTPHRSEGA